ncbi:hypothetical protein CLIB1444_02S17040 [[Candida] jaroonii]|uniref:Uncharacterized protein n=1 Tax=[Candida] jaroonii TaxID=467808 RepID=A0ACA9Y4A3_9ASCO|nr:hypothetical protein CLIB1444_02S17040 [[Candida] jaroonii]
MNEVWETKRCKRVVRPLLSKIHSLTQLVIKSPSTLDITIQPKFTTSSNIHCKPSNSHHRLKCLKPHITLELYGYYEELFYIFQQIMTSLNVKGDFTTLASHCSYNIGKAMVLSSRNSYFRLNNSSLFDPNTLPGTIKQYHDTLSPDIDGWLDMESLSTITCKMDLLLGYVIHLLVFNQKILYLIIPTLVHWLYEQSLPRNLKLKYMATYLFHEYWKFNDKYYDNIDPLIITQLTGLDNQVTCFWDLEKIKYWDHLVSSLDIKSTFPDQHYNNLLLNVISSKLDYDLDYIYTKLQDHPQTNNILASVLTKLINRRNKNSIEDLTKLVGVWLGFRDSMIFNSLLPGNEDLFYGIMRFHKYLTNTESQALILLKSFYLDQPQTLSDDPKIIDQLMTFQSIGFLERLPLSHHRDVNDFIFWLVENNMRNCGKRMFLLIYGDYEYYDEVDYLYDTVFNY